MRAEPARTLEPLIELRLISASSRYATCARERLTNVPPSTLALTAADIFA